MQNRKNIIMAIASAFIVLGVTGTIVFWNTYHDQSQRMGNNTDSEAQPYQPNGVIDESGHRYVNEQYGFTLTFPEDWSALTIQYLQNVEAVAASSVENATADTIFDGGGAKTIVHLWPMSENLYSQVANELLAGRVPWETPGKEMLVSSKMFPTLSLETAMTEGVVFGDVEEFSTIALNDYDSGRKRVLITAVRLDEGHVVVLESLLSGHQEDEKKLEEVLSIHRSFKRRNAVATENTMLVEKQVNGASRLTRPYFKTALTVPVGWEYPEVQNNYVELPLFSLAKNDEGDMESAVLSSQNSATLSVVLAAEATAEPGDIAHIQANIASETYIPHPYDGAVEDQWTVKSTQYKKEEKNGKVTVLHEYTSTAPNKSEVLNGVEYIIQRSEGEYIVLTASYGNGSEKQKIRNQLIEIVNSLEVN